MKNAGIERGNVLLVEEQGIPKKLIMLFYLNKEPPPPSFLYAFNSRKGKITNLLPTCAVFRRAVSLSVCLSVCLFIVRCGLAIYSLGCLVPWWFHSWQSSCLRLCSGRIRTCNTTSIQPSCSKPFCYFFNLFTYF